METKMMVVTSGVMWVWLICCFYKGWSQRSLLYLESFIFIYWENTHMDW